MKIDKAIRKACRKEAEKLKAAVNLEPFKTRIRIAWFILIGKW